MKVEKLGNRTTHASLREATPSEAIQGKQAFCGLFPTSHSGHLAEVPMNIRDWRTIEEGEAVLREWDRRDVVFGAQSLRPGRVEFIGKLRRK